MKSKHFTILALFVLVFAFAAQAKVVVYKTFDDYTNKKGTEYDDYKMAMVQMGKVTLHLTKGDAVEKVKCTEIWGFTYNDKLFRIDNIGSPIMLWSEGKIFYWENGTAHMEAMRRDRDHATLTSGFANFLTKDLNSEILTLTSGMGAVKKEVQAFVASYPASQSLFDCIGKVNIVDKTRECVESFQK